MVLRAFRDVIYSIKDQAVIQEIVRLLEVGNVDGVIDLLQLDEDTFEPFVESIRDSYRVGGMTGAEQLGSIPTAFGTLVARFNVRNPVAEQWIRDMSSRLITEVVGDQVTGIRETLTLGLAQGQGPKSTALDLVGRIDKSTGKREGGMIGMTSQQMGWVRNARVELETLNRAYFSRSLRDKRYDRMVGNAIALGKPLTQSQINTIVNALQTRTVRYRGEAIARTESINALRAGQFQSVEQAIKKGNLDRRDFTKIWDDTGDLRTRPDHRLLAREYEEGIPFDQAFIAPDGSRLMFPGDNSLGASAKQIIQCRCKVIIKYNAADKLRRLEGFG